MEADEAADGDHDPEEEERDGGVASFHDARVAHVGRDVGGRVDLREKRLVRAAFLFEIFSSLRIPHLAADEPEDRGAEEHLEVVRTLGRLLAVDLGRPHARPCESIQN